MGRCVSGSFEQDIQKFEPGNILDGVPGDAFKWMFILKT
jgi:hypothetical protein